MNSLPKLLPSWHDLTVHDLVRQKTFKKFVPLNPPDFGGIGIDVNVDAESPCTIPKFYNSQIKFSSDRCALPFFPLKSKDDLTEPCLEALEKEKNEFDQFSLGLTHIRNIASTKRKYREKLKSLQEKIKSVENIDHCEEISIIAPQSIVKLAETIPKRAAVPAFNVSYVGGDLAVCRYSEKQALVHPSCDNCNELSISPLLDGYDRQFTPEMSELTVRLKDEPIFQVDEAINGFCVRQEKSFHLINVNDLNVYSKSVHKAALYHIAANPYNPAEILSIYEKGVMKIRNMITKQTIWSMLDNMYDDYYTLYPTWRCAFGSNPFSIMCLNESKFYGFDIREEKNTVRVIFNADNPSFYIGEELVCLRQWNRNTFQHFLTSSHHLTLCDERYPKTPVMHWNHCLKNHPVYLECADIDSDVNIIVIATQKSPQIASFFCSNQTDIQPVSLSPPLQLSSPSDCVKSLKFHSYYIDDKLSKRFSSPLTGVCIVPHISKIGFTVLQRTSAGDIFYQDFKQSSEEKEKTYHVSTGCIFTPPDKILPHLNELMLNSDSHNKVSNRNEDCIEIAINIDKILKLNIPMIHLVQRICWSTTLFGDSLLIVLNDNNVVPDSLQYDTATCLLFIFDDHGMATSISIIYEAPAKEISASCTFCRLNSSAEDKSLVCAEICPTCNLSGAESEYFSKAMANESLLIGPISDKAGYLDCDVDELKRFDDKYSKRILSVWTESNEVDENSEVEADRIQTF